MAETSSGGRDLVGYGANPPAVPWPNGARLAVSVVVNYRGRLGILPGHGRCDPKRG